jgi:DNA-binding NarL/FixJ family response regulator
MTKTVTIAIIDNDRYFAQGLKALLMYYCTLKQISIRFLPERRSADATLLFQSNSFNRSARHCRQQRHHAHKQTIVVLAPKKLDYDQRHRVACLSESGIARCVSVEAFLLHIEHILTAPSVVTPIRRCPRCASALTPREWQVLAAIEQGRIVKQVAQLMNLAPKTVSAHKCNAMAKLGLIRNTELYHWLQNGGLNYELREH